MLIKIKQHGIILMTAVTLVLLSCGKEKLRPVKYAEYVENPENGLKATHTANGFEYTVQYEPIDYKILKAYRGKELNESLLQQERESYDSLQYFILKIRSADNKDVMKQGLENEAAYYGRLQYLSSLVQHDLYVIENNDSLHCVLSHFERDYSLSPQITLVLAFEGRTAPGHDSSDKIFVFDDRTFANAQVKLAMEGDDIKNIPALITE